MSESNGGALGEIHNTSAVRLVGQLDHSSKELRFTNMEPSQQVQCGYNAHPSLASEVIALRSRLANFSLLNPDRFHGLLPPPMLKVPFDGYIWYRKCPARVSRASKPFSNQGTLEGVG
jgi:hypothetical protein